MTVLIRIRTSCPIIRTLHCDLRTLSQLHLSDLVQHYPFIYLFIIFFFTFFFCSLSGEDVSMFVSIVN